MAVQEIVLAKGERPPLSDEVQTKMENMFALDDSKHKRMKYVVDKLTNECAETFLSELVASDNSWAVVDAWYRSVFFLSRPDLEERLANAARYTPAELQKTLEQM